MVQEIRSFKKTSHFIQGRMLGVEGGAYTRYFTVHTVCGHVCTYMYVCVTMCVCVCECVYCTCMCVHIVCLCKCLCANECTNVLSLLMHAWELFNQ